MFVQTEFSILFVKVGVILLRYGFITEKSENDIKSHWNSLGSLYNELTKKNPQRLKIVVTTHTQLERITVDRIDMVHEKLQ